MEVKHPTELGEVFCLVQAVNQDNQAVNLTTEYSRTGWRVLGLVRLAVPD
jgi:hypothetical protein